jgi:DNA-binding response OmpR family regulator
MREGRRMIVHPTVTVRGGAPVQKLRILVAEDEVNLRDVLCLQLRRANYDVIESGDGEQALELATRNLPDLILLDVMMPRMSGYDLCQKVRENPAWAGIRIIMLSAKGRDIEVTKGMAVGADAYVTKPFSTKDLIAKVQELLGE